MPTPLAHRSPAQGHQVVVIACEYGDASKGARVIGASGDDPGAASVSRDVILREKLTRRVRPAVTDLPVLVRMDTLKYLRAQEVSGPAAALSNQTRHARTRRVPVPLPGSRAGAAQAEQRNEWATWVWWDREDERSRAAHPRPGRQALGVGDRCSGSVEVTLAAVKGPAPVFTS